jgi:hypothetical protein
MNEQRLAIVLRNLLRLKMCEERACRRRAVIQPPIIEFSLFSSLYVVLCKHVLPTYVTTTLRPNTLWVYCLARLTKNSVRFHSLLIVPIVLISCFIFPCYPYPVSQNTHIYFRCVVPSS